MLLKQKLQSMSNNELKALILDLAKLRKENIEWLQAKIKGQDGIIDTLEYFKKKILAALWPEPKIRLHDAKKAIADFRKISNKPEHIIELMTFYVETGIEVENEFGDLYEAFYASIESVFEKVIKALNTNQDLIHVYTKRLNLIVERSAEGWGHKDSLSDILYNLNAKEGAE